MSPSILRVLFSLAGCVKCCVYGQDRGLIDNWGNLTNHEALNSGETGRGRPHQVHLATACTGPSGCRPEATSSNRVVMMTPGDARQLSTTMAALIVDAAKVSKGKGASGALHWRLSPLS